MTNGAKAPLGDDVRAIIGIVLLDVYAGAWLKLNLPDVAAAFAGFQVPLLGIGGALWGFLPDERKKKLGAKVLGFLRHGFVSWALVVVGGVASGASFVVSTV